jgi:hypothetical protein
MEELGMMSGKPHKRRFPSGQYDRANHKQPFDYESAAGPLTM